MGFVFCIVLLYCLGDLYTLLQMATGFPFVQLYFNITKNHVATTTLTLFHALTTLAANSAGLTSTSGTAWAFARDGAFPFGRYFVQLDERSGLPDRMCVLLTVLQFLLGLIYIGNTTALNAIWSMSILGMYASYVLPVRFMLFYGRTSAVSHRQGYFSLGSWGPVVNVVALLWGLVAMLFSMLPSYQSVTRENMNYSSLVLGGWTIGGALYYAARQRTNYEGSSAMLWELRF